MADVAGESAPIDANLALRTPLRVAADLVLILSGSIFTGLLTIAPSPVLHSIADHFGDAKFLAQMIMVVPSVGVVLAGFFVGSLIDRVGVRRVLLVSAASYAVLGALGMVLENLYLLLASRFLLGMAGSGIYGSTFTLAGERYNGSILGKVLGYKGAVGAGGATLTVLAAGHLAEAFGWRAVFSLYLIAAVVFLLAWGIRDAERKAVHADAPKQSFKPVIDMWPIFLMMLLIFSATFTPNAQGAFLLRENGVNPANFKNIIASSSFAYMIASAVYGHIRGLLGGQTVFRIGLMFAFLAAFGSAFLTEGVVVMALCFGMHGLGNGLMAPYLHAMVLERAPADVRGRASALVSPAHYGGEFINPFIFATFKLAGGIHAAFAVLGICMFVAAVLLKPDGWRRLPGSPAAAAIPPT